MVIHTQVDWRTPTQALEWDTALVRGVFWHICKRYDQEAEAKLARQARHALSKSTTNNDQEDYQREAPPQEATAYVLEEHRLVAKADVLIGLRATEHFLDKRPFLRSLATMLACCSNEKEMESVESYVKYRLRERTISFAMVRDQLEEIYKKHVDLVAFEAKVEEFKASARAKSTWCVRDPKAIRKSPSQLYGIHNLPPKPKTQKQIEMERQLITSHATAVVNNAITLVLSQLVDAARPKSRQRSAKSSRPENVSRGGGTPPAKLSAAAKAKQKREQQYAEARCKALRLQVLVPGILHTRQSTDFGCLPIPSNVDADILEVRRTKQAKQLELLALIEANGDHVIADRLMQQLIPRSGFVRVVEHLSNLGGGGKADETPDEWAVYKLWKTVYRNRTVQSVQRLEQ
jgi:hypothetical protein